MILIGTSGFSYDDWRGQFYSINISKSEMLPYYSSRFPVVEINSTYYALPGLSAFCYASLRALSRNSLTLCLLGIFRLELNSLSLREVSCSCNIV